MVYCGIDLGTTNALVTCFSEAGAEPLLLDGSLFLPSCVYVGQERTEVGESAKNHGRLDCDRLIASSKRYMPDRKIWTIDGVDWTPQMAAKEILKKIAAYIREEKQQDDSDIPEEIFAVITVPACWPSAACRATKQAAQEAGIHCIGLLPEPVAAAQAYASYYGTDERLLIVDVGGGTFDLAIVDSTSELMCQRDVGGDPQLGGDDFDKAIAENILRPALSDPSGRRPDELLDIARIAKYQLQEAESAAIERRLSNNSILNIRISRDQYIDVCGGLHGRMAIALENLIRGREDQFSKVVVVGGMGKDPNVLELLRSYPEFKDKFSGPQENYMSMVSAGAALHCWNLKNRNAHVVNFVTYTAIGIATDNNDGKGTVFTSIIPKGTSVPLNGNIKKTMRFSNSKPELGYVTLNVYESGGGGEDLGDCIPYGSYTVPMRSVSGNGNDFLVSMELNADRVLTVYDGENNFRERIDLEKTDRR